MEGTSIVKTQPLNMKLNGLWQDPTYVRTTHQSEVRQQRDCGVGRSLQKIGSTWDARWLIARYAAMLQAALVRSFVA